MTPGPGCAGTCPLVTRLVIDLARATGRTEADVRLTHGIVTTSDEAIHALRQLLTEMPVTLDPRGWLDARLHELEHPEGR